MGLGSRFEAGPGAVFQKAVLASSGGGLLSGLGWSELGNRSLDLPAFCVIIHPLNFTEGIKTKLYGPVTGGP